MPLFVSLAEGRLLVDELRAAILAAIRRDASPTHVPDEVIQLPTIPRTLTGKKLEIPVKRILLGTPAAEAAAKGALADATALEPFEALARSRA